MTKKKFSAFAATPSPTESSLQPPPKEEEPIPKSYYGDGIVVFGVFTLIYGYCAYPSVAGMLLF